MPSYAGASRQALRPSLEHAMSSLPDASNILADPAVSSWLRRALASGLERDPVDAANDAELLSEVLSGRCAALLRSPGDQSSAIAEHAAGAEGLFRADLAWDRLSADQQRGIGVAALVLAVGIAGDWAGRSPYQAFVAAAVAGQQAVLEAAETALGPLNELPRPNLAPIGVEACTSCGCTDEVACPNGCGWVMPGLCTNCDPGHGLPVPKQHPTT